LTEELAAVDDMIGKLRADVTRLDTIGDANDATHQLRGRYTIQLIQLEARRASITALVAARRSLAGDSP
jgi:phage host-nuclease inhibitor protein Gam